MSVMDRDGDRARRRRMWGVAGSVLMIVMGGLGTLTGFVVGRARTGDAATGWGVLAGVGVATLVIGLVKLWIDRHAETEANDPGGSAKRERLQTERSRMLWIFPIVAIIFLFQAISATLDVLAGQGSWGDYMSLFLPVLYAWVVAMIVMGWDAHTRKNRRFMEDELVLVIRARAMTAASLVLMAGMTIAFGLGLWRPEIGVLAIPCALTIGAATAGIRFAWLDREAGKDG